MAKTQFNSIIDLINKFPNEQACLAQLKELRWKDGIYCPHCGFSEKIYEFKDGKTFKCASCRKKFTAKVGSIFEDSPLPLQKWFLAIYLITSHKKGISSVQLAKDINVTQKTAWYMLHRLRHVSQTKSFNRSLSNTVEADETYIGGKEKNKHADKRTKNNQGRSTKTKTAVIGVKERGGNVKAQVVADTKGKTVKNFIVENVVIGSNLMTDEYRAYRGLGFAYTHDYVKHGKGEYVKGFCHTNGIENFWSILKRGIVGIYHFVSEKHLNNYLAEFAFRHNTRDLEESVRFNLFLENCQGRLQYSELIA
ncbi:MAG: IS1595 family transposase [Anaerolineae bacterium]|jgi:transposase-like protein|nr:IS1595 family transposase [Anaerolineae bacterium]MBT4310933.1 IS1595 family transposase [Anaerolineae bacterium]MBT4456953.1 IS1595 family transposase [Anaerolineae bacterium]MBT6060756.1 IS1595 family transposase [Anaerolineae bacterium]MBT6324111.1 IS1595 family transposase [Anaerolineae bacterium]